VFKFSPLKNYGFQTYTQETKNLVISTVTTSSAIVNEGTPEERWDESPRKYYGNDITCCGTFCQIRGYNITVSIYAIRNAYQHTVLTMYIQFVA
jgi:hypothetical protein